MDSGSPSSSPVSPDEAVSNQSRGAGQSLAEDHWVTSAAGRGFASDASPEMHAPMIQHDKVSEAAQAALSAADSAGDPGISTVNSSPDFGFEEGLTLAPVDSTVQQTERFSTLDVSPAADTAQLPTEDPVSFEAVSLEVDNARHALDHGSDHSAEEEHAVLLPQGATSSQRQPSCAETEAPSCASSEGDDLSDMALNGNDIMEGGSSAAGISASLGGSGTSGGRQATSVAANPYWLAEGRAPLASGELREALETPSSRAHKALMDSLAALPLEARRMLPETIAALLQMRRRSDEPLVGHGADSSSGPGLGGLAEKIDEAGVLRKVNRHLLTRFMMLTVLCYLDRTNLAFAALQLNRDLGFSELVYGLGSSVFFFTYAIAQVPSNMALVRVGGPLWLGIIVTFWGIVATCFAGLTTATSFYVLRLLLGLAEAGTFPGLWYMLTLFYTTSEVAVAYAICQAGSVAAQVVGAPLAAGLLAMDGFLGLDGWQWLFLAEGLPTVAFGIWLRMTLADAPATAKFLQPAERQWLSARNQAHKEMAADMAEVEWEGIRHWKTWALAALDICISTTKYALLYFLPLIIYQILGARNDRAADAAKIAEGGKVPLHDDDDGFTAGEGEGPNEVLVALLTAVPFAVAAFSTVGNAWHSKRSGERLWHVVAPLVVSAASMVALASTMGSHAGLAFASLMGAVLAWAPGGILSAYPSAYLSGPAAASGWAVVNAVGALVGGMAGPLVVGTLKHRTGNYSASVLVLAAVMAGGALFAYFVLPVISPDSLLKARVHLAVPPKYVSGEGHAGEGDSLTGSASEGGGDAAPVPAQTVQLTRLASC